jgi:hypothetical protein
MGSVLSFPILCIANFVAYWVAMDRTFGPVPVDKLAVRVNGDDILFPTNSDLHKVWESVVRGVGFDLSIGKSYVHKSVMCVNSTFFVERRNGTIERVEYLPTGLLIGQKKVQTRRQVRRAVWDNLNIVLAGSSQPSRSLRRFLHYNKETIKIGTKNGLLNLFIPRHYGGLGVNPCGADFYVTRFQRHYAHYCDLVYTSRESEVVRKKRKLNITLKSLQNSDYRPWERSSRRMLVDPYHPMCENWCLPEKPVGLGAYRVLKSARETNSIEVEHPNDSIRASMRWPASSADFAIDMSPKRLVLVRGSACSSPKTEEPYEEPLARIV